MISSRIWLRGALSIVSSIKMHPKSSRNVKYSLKYRSQMIGTQNTNFNVKYRPANYYANGNNLTYFSAASSFSALCPYTVVTMTVAGHPSRNETDFNGILLAPAPWKLKARMWHFLVSPLKANTVNGKSNAVFPAGWAAPFQAEPLAEGEFVTGHPGVIMLVQYTDTPVGPYDELIYIAGKFSMHKEPDSNETNKAETGFRITRIYVSTKESAANGRRNWTIAKELAEFKYTRHSDGSWDLAVFPSNPLISETLETPAEVRRPNIPFFHISIHPIPILGSLCIPINFNILGSYFRLLDPPIPNGPPGSSPALVKSNTNSDGSIKEPKWASLVPGIKGKMRLVTYKPKVDVGSDLEGEDGRKRKAHLAIADGVNFPAVVPWKMGACLEGVDIHFDAPEWL